jgi:hypothetical protein
MKELGRLVVSTLSALTLTVQAATAQTGADTSPSTSRNPSTAPDNTKSNRQNPPNTDQTADQQTNNSTDLDVAKRIRRSVTEDKNLSTYGHNVKIVAVSGHVTLNGVVRSDDEKAAIAAKAASVVGKEHVVNDLKVAPSK